MDELGWKTAHIVGNSLGGWVAFELERRGWFWGEVALGRHPVDLRQGSGDCAHARLLA